MPESPDFTEFLHTTLARGLTNDELRTAIALGAKQLLPPRWWDYSQALEYRSFGGRTLAHTPPIAELERAFLEATAHDLSHSNTSELIQFARELADYYGCVRDPKCKLRLKKKYLSKMRNRLLDALRDRKAFSENDLLYERAYSQGLRYWFDGVKSQFLNRRRYRRAANKID